MDALTRVRDLVRSATGTMAADVRRVAGGDVCEAWRVELADGRTAFVKTLGDRDPSGTTTGLFPTEAAGLRWLAEPGALPLPDPWGATDEVLVLPWVDAGPGGARPATELGRGLARTHAAGAASFGTPGPTWIGTLRFAASSGRRWGPWFAEHRVLPLARQARDAGALDGAGLRAVDAVAERIDVLAGPDEPPARLHGDLWTGNVRWGADGRAWLVDPAAYAGHRETDLAMLALFGVPHEDRLLAAYAEEAPLADGWAERVPLHQLLPLLVHAVLFGGGYGARAAAVARHYA